ncbi:MAG: hypothetical protein KDD48_05530 [Bdellovibrionales bacterium]|nr:hypothetical protein [Bdellovibrionales bacterium]
MNAMNTKYYLSQSLFTLAIYIASGCTISPPDGTSRAHFEQNGDQSHANDSDQRFASLEFRKTNTKKRGNDDPSTPEVSGQPASRSDATTQAPPPAAKPLTKEEGDALQSYVGTYNVTANFLLNTAVLDWVWLKDKLEAISAETKSLDNYDDRTALCRLGNKTDRPPGDFDAVDNASIAVLFTYKAFNAPTGCSQCSDENQDALYNYFATTTVEEKYVLNISEVNPESGAVVGDLTFTNDTGSEIKMPIDTSVSRVYLNEKGEHSLYIKAIEKNATFASFSPFLQNLEMNADLAKDKDDSHIINRAARYTRELYILGVVSGEQLSGTASLIAYSDDNTNVLNCYFLGGGQYNGQATASIDFAAFNPAKEASKSTATASNKGIPQAKIEPDENAKAPSPDKAIVAAPSQKDPIETALLPSPEESKPNIDVTKNLSNKAEEEDASDIAKIEEELNDPLLDLPTDYRPAYVIKQASLTPADEKPEFPYIQQTYTRAKINEFCKDADEQLLSGIFKVKLKMPDIYRDDLSKKDARNNTRVMAGRVSQRVLELEENYGQLTAAAKVTVVRTRLNKVLKKPEEFYWQMQGCYREEGPSYMFFRNNLRSPFSNNDQSAEWYAATDPFPFMTKTKRNKIAYRVLFSYLVTHEEIVEILGSMIASGFESPSKWPRINIHLTGTWKIKNNGRGGEYTELPRKTKIKQADQVFWVSTDQNSKIKTDWDLITGEEFSITNGVRKEYTMIPNDNRLSLVGHLDPLWFQIEYDI